CGPGDLELGRVQLPEVPHPEREPSAGTANVTEARGAGSPVHSYPGVTRAGALVDLEAVGVELAQAVFAPGRDPVQAGGDPLVPSGGVRGRLSRNLRGACFLTGIAAYAQLSEPGDVGHDL